MPPIFSKLKLYDAERSIFVQYAAKHTAAQVKAETGFSADVLELLWDKYKHCLPKRQRDQEMRLIYFYFVFRYMHMYPTWEQAPVVLWTPELVGQKGSGISRATLHEQVLTYLALLAVHIDEVHWSDRLNEYNHTEHFQTRVTTIVDTAPVGVEESTRKHTASMTFQPKYKDNVFKLQVHASDGFSLSVCVQIGISLTGQIVLYTGLHWGVSPDNLIWRWTAKDHPMEPEELAVGDGIYQSKNSAAFGVGDRYCR
jgi:hypothetical protein